MKFTESSEWLTLVLNLSCYSFLGILVFAPLSLPVIFQILALIPLLTLHSSLQHEALHGHPFKAQWLNDALVFLPAGLLTPYFRFKDTHTRHHNNAFITNPFEDPESFYQSAARFSARPQWQQKMFQLNNTLLGRLIIGPAMSAVGFAAYEVQSGGRRVQLTWALHLVVVAGLLVMISAFGQLPLWAYLVAAYFGYSLLMLRTFLEHQAHTDIDARSVIIADRGLLSLLFLNNNFHILHHTRPGVPWYRLPSLYDRDPEGWRARNQGYFYRNYSEVIARYLLSEKEPVAFPDEPRSQSKVAS